MNDLINKAFPSVEYPAFKHVMVKGDRSIFDGDLPYWAARNSKHYDGPTARTLARQNRLCGYCGLQLIGEEKVHLHHKDGNHSNWSKQKLLAVYQSCHQYYHMSTRRIQAMER